MRLREPQEWKEKYPLVFRADDSPYIECYVGWYSILDEFLGWMEDVIRRTKETDTPGIAQIKEKYGSLRIYLNIPDFWYTKYQEECQYIDKAIEMAVNQSMETCELCGKPGHVVGTGWLACRCSECKRKV